MASRLSIESARGGRVSFQVGVRAADQSLSVEVETEAEPGLEVEVRYVGTVPLVRTSSDTPAEDLEVPEHIPTLVPDPLLWPAKANIRPGETHAFWVTVVVDPEAQPGSRDIRVRVGSKGSTLRLIARLNIHNAVLAARRDFPVTNWLKANAIVDWYQAPMIEERFWRLLATYVSNMVAHGQDMIFVPLITPAVEGDKRPTQLLGISRDGDSYGFDWTLVERWVDVCRARGLVQFEWPHLFSQWGAVHTPNLYEGHGEGERLLWPSKTHAGSGVYRSFLQELLPEFHRFLIAKRVLRQSVYHLSDEPRPADLSSYSEARSMLRSLAPWMKVVDALSDPRFYSEGHTDVPVALVDVAPQFVQAGAPAWAYFCCIPRGRYVNRFLDTPLLKIRMLGWVLFKMRAGGFLHWGYNYWYRALTRELIDPFIVTDAMNGPEWPAGDPFVVYPGPTGPIDSIRWEVFAESLQDLALLQGSGIGPEHPLLEDIHDYADFPRDPEWMVDRRRQLLTRIDALSPG